MKTTKRIVITVKGDNIKMTTQGLSKYEIIGLLEMHKNMVTEKIQPKLKESSCQKN